MSTSFTQYRVLATNGQERTTKYFTDYLEAEAIAEQLRETWPSVSVQRRQITRWQTMPGYNDGLLRRIDMADLASIDSDEAQS